MATITKVKTPDGVTHTIGGSGSGDLTYVHNQSTASATWNITHNLGKYPSISVVDSAGNDVVGDYDYTGINSVKLTFAGAFSGKAYLN